MGLVAPRKSLPHFAQDVRVAVCFALCHGMVLCPAYLDRILFQPNAQSLCPRTATRAFNILSLGMAFGTNGNSRVGRRLAKTARKRSDLLRHRTGCKVHIGEHRFFAFHELHLCRLHDAGGLLDVAALYHLESKQRSPLLLRPLRTCHQQSARKMPILRLQERRTCQNV